MPVSVNPVRNDAADRNIQLLGTALGLAKDVYKVNMDSKAADAASKLTADNRDAALSSEDKKLAFQAEENEKNRQAQNQTALAKIKASAEEADKDRRLKSSLFAMGSKAKENDKPLTDGEKTANLFGKRMYSSHNVLNQVENDPNIGVTSLSTAISNFLPNEARSKELQQYNNAKTNFLTAVLRKESGASIAPSEREEGEKLYFAQRGDSPELVAQKQATREQVIQDFQQMAGKAWSGGSALASAPPKTGTSSSMLDSAQAAPGGQKFLYQPGSILEIGGRKMVVGPDGKTAAPLK